MTDDELIETIARAMFKDDQINRLDIAKAALDACRPVIEAPLRGKLEEYKKDADEYLVRLDELNALRAENARLRNETLEEAAKVAEGFPKNREWVPGSLYDTLRREVAQDIRRLK